MPEHDEVIALQAAYLFALGIPFSFRFTGEREVELVWDSN